MAPALEPRRTNQDIQKELVDKARENPEVERALTAYESFRRSAVVLQPVESKVKHATGANS
jgi:hypothetical protein